MITAYGIARIGKDAEVRHTNGGAAVVNLALAFSYGRKGEDGKKPTTWIDASLWGKLAEALAPYLTKGTQVCVSVSDVHMEQYESRNGTGHKLVGLVSEIELAGGGQRHESAPQASRPTQSLAPKTGSDRFADMDDDIPFAPHMRGIVGHVI